MSRINIDEPLWDQSTFVGRFKHFMWVTDPRTGICSEAELYAAKTLVEQYRRGSEPAGTTREQVIYAKKLYESAFHPDTGDLQNVFGRMSFQLPGGMALTGAMLQFYKTIPQVVFWQWVNQSFNAVVNYTNRNAKSSVSPVQLGVAYVTATTSALATAIGCKQWGQKAPPIFQRYVPFIAVAAANCVNIPLMRNQEIVQGIDVQDENGNVVSQSKFAAAKGISQVVISRVFMALPGMTILPVITEKLETQAWYTSMSALHAPFQVIAAGCFLFVMVPTACALFPQKCSVKSSTLKMIEPGAYAKLEKNSRTIPERVYFNKGL